MTSDGWQLMVNGIGIGKLGFNKSNGWQYNRKLALIGVKTEWSLEWLNMVGEMQWWEGFESDCLAFIVMAYVLFICCFLSFFLHVFPCYFPWFILVILAWNKLKASVYSPNFCFNYYYVQILDRELVGADKGGDKGGTSGWFHLSMHAFWFCSLVES